MFKSYVWSQVRYTFIACVGSFLFGIGIGWSSPSALKILETEKSFEMSENQFAWAVSMNSFGMMVACSVNGRIRDRYGSKIAILIFTLPSCVGWMVLTFAKTWWMVVMGRFLVGISAGGYGYTVLTYIGECASKEVRGTLMTFFEIFLKVGILFSYVLGAITDLMKTNLICGVIAVCYGAAFMTLPESPWFLLTQYKKKKAKESLRHWRGSINRVDDELANIEQEIIKLKAERKSFLDEIRQESTRNAFLITFTMLVFFNFCGIIPVVFYASTILINSGIRLNPFAVNCFLGLMQLFSGFLATVFIDRFGRRALFISSNVIMIFNLVGIGIYFHIKDKVNVCGYEWMLIFMLCFYLFGFSIGVGSVTYLLIGEMFSFNAKRVIGPLAQGIEFFISFLVAAFFPTVANTIGMHFTFFIFALNCCIAIVFIIFKLPETKGKSLIEIQELLVKK